MGNLMTKLTLFFALSVIFATSAIGSAKAEEIQESAIEQGKNIAFNRKKGNCLACHYVQGGTLMGTTGPGLIAMKQRFPEREKLVAQVTDARINNKNTIMPPFGTHGALTEQEIELVVDWLYTL